MVFSWFPKRKTKVALLTCWKVLGMTETEERGGSEGRRRLVDSGPKREVGVGSQVCGGSRAGRERAELGSLHFLLLLPMD